MARSSSGGRVDISATTKKIDVDNGISLQYYFRIANNVLKQADIFREEGNIVDLYVMLLRFSSLVTETIPCHRDYRTSANFNRNYLKGRVITALTELEELRPAVQAKLEELRTKQIYQLNKQQSSWKNDTQVSSVEWPAVKQNWKSYNTTKTLQPVSSKYGYQGLKPDSHMKPVVEHLHRTSLSLPRPKEETLSKHSILGPNGLRGQWQPPSNYKVVRKSPAIYDIMVSNSPHAIKDETTTREDDVNSEQEKSNLEAVVQPKNDGHLIKESDSLISFESAESSAPIEIIRQPSPPPLLADVQDLVPTSTAATQAECGMESSSTDALPCSEEPLQLHISTELMNSFMKLAKSNTDKNLETCGVLAGSLRNRKFFITALIIPKQESTSDSCQTTNEEEIFEVQDKQCLFPLGWIHTHPTQSCFMSSIDVHTHYSYQMMLPESIAIVMAPKDNSRTHGIFRLTSGGMTVIRQCPRRGFHSHEPPSDDSTGLLTSDGYARLAADMHRSKVRHASHLAAAVASDGCRSTAGCGRGVWWRGATVATCGGARRATDHGGS
ncbi:AMSH-like ubiquitin thioesterase 1 [Striga hermonthica]|uniref:AMSH-like ubiquitin thioesterase 1 n=1 Tax=Striga hermonthica TaxID=68872 RepID=A0A9N7MUK8_STRHE|nr:AMSH-like ubiquitin thioesterase 1 [Striga hermonthica]